MMVKKKSICLILPSLRCGGMERVMLELGKYFYDKNGVEIHLVLLTKQKKFYDVPDGINLYEPNFNYKDYSGFVSLIRTWRYMRRVVGEINPDRILSFGGKHNWFVIFSLYFIRDRIFLSDQGMPGRNYSFLQNLLNPLFYPRVSGIIALTDEEKAVLSRGVDKSKICVIPNPVRDFNKMSVKKENIILNVGRLVKLKRQDILISIFAKLDRSDWKLVFLGDGPEKSRLKKLAKDMGVEKRVSFLGNVKNVEKYYFKSKVFAFTSSSEGFPVVLLEALSVGLPLIGFNSCPGISELIKDGKNGFLVPEGDIEGYGEKLKIIMTNKKIRDKFTKQAKRDILKYNIKKVGDEYYTFLF